MINNLLINCNEISKTSINSLNTRNIVYPLFETPANFPLFRRYDIDLVTTSSTHPLANQ